MSVTDHTVDEAHDDHDDHGHPTDRKYVNIAILLGVLTAIEILLFVFEDDLGGAIVKTGLLGLMAIKFYIVGAFFMHLKFDNKVLTQLFVFGLILAVVVYIAMLSTFELWNSGISDPGLPGDG
ncbi:MAG: cytochrome C oxidase subunit IV family protein [Acidimicrobiales bacterium]